MRNDPTGKGLDRVSNYHHRRDFLSRTNTIPAIIARMPTSTPDGDGCGGVLVVGGAVVSTGVAGTVVTGLVVAIVPILVVVGGIVVVGEDTVAGVVGNPRGSPRSMKTLAADWGFSALMENVRVAVLDDVRKATTARPSRSVVTRA